MAMYCTKKKEVAHFCTHIVINKKVDQTKSISLKPAYAIKIIIVTLKMRVKHSTRVPILAVILFLTDVWYELPNQCWVIRHWSWMQMLD